MLTKVLVEIPNDYIDQARDTSDEVNSYLQKEYGCFSTLTQSKIGANEGNKICKNQKIINFPPTAKEV